MAGWIKSSSTFDTLLISLGDWRSVFVSGNHKFQLIFQRQRSIQFFMLNNTEGKDIPKMLEIDQESFDYDWTLDQSSTIDRLVRAQYADQDQQQIMLIPYWSVTVPLTLIAAWLLLTKVRKPNQAKIVEPIPTQGM